MPAKRMCVNSVSTDSSLFLVKGEDLESTCWSILVSCWTVMVGLGWMDLL